MPTWQGQPTPSRDAWRPGQAALVTGVFVVLLWVLEIVDTATGHALDPYGVQPRTEDGLVGIAVAPLLHLGFGHLISNTVPVAVLGFLTLATGVARGLLATATIWVVGGLGVLPGQPGVSWQGHLFGAIGGFLAARVLTRRPREETYAY